MNGIKDLAHLVELIAATCIHWERREFDFKKCRSLIRVFMGLERPS